MHKKKFRFKPSTKPQAIRIGSEVVDRRNYRGIVVELIPAKVLSESDEGLITVWQKDRVDYGADNCEHYHFLHWSDFLKVIKY